MILVYDQTGVPGALDDLVQSIEGRVFLRSAAHYRGPEVASQVYTDSEKIAQDYAARGVDVYDLEGEPVASDEGATESDPEDGTHEVGGGWYDIVINGEVVDRSQGKARAQDRYEQLTGDSNNEYTD